MVGRIRRTGIGVVAAVALAACLSGCVFTGDDQTIIHQQAQADLTRWAAAVAAAGGSSAFIPINQLTGQIGDWEVAVGDNNKPALMAGLVESAVGLPAETPPDGIASWPNGITRTSHLISAQQALAAMKADPSNSTCPECTPLRITGAQLTTSQVETSRGPAQAPVWEFTIQGTAVRVTRLAIAHPVTVVDPNISPVGMRIDSATGTVTGRELTVSFTGAPEPASQGCGADYTAEAVESASAVVVIVTEHRPWSLFGQACTAVGAIRTATAEMAVPLGDRTVLEVTQGRPVAAILAN
jgi:hypothetical protein